MAILAAPAAYSEVASTVTESEPGTLLGNYLSGRVARGDHDTAAAADFYSRALAEDPNNELILEQAFLLETAAADWNNAIKLARELVKVEPSHRIAQSRCRRSSAVRVTRYRIFMLAPWTSLESNLERPMATPSSARFTETQGQYLAFVHAY